MDTEFDGGLFGLLPSPDQSDSSGPELGRIGTGHVISLPDQATT